MGGLGFGEGPVICRIHWDVLGKNATENHLFSFLLQ